MVGFSIHSSKKPPKKVIGLKKKRTSGLWDPLPNRPFHGFFLWGFLTISQVGRPHPPSIRLILGVALNLAFGVSLDIREGGGQ